MLDANTIAILNQMGFDAGNIESLMSSLIVVAVLTVITAIPTGILAKRKGRSRTFWLLLALSIPVVPLLLIWLLPKLPSADPSAER